MVNLKGYSDQAALVGRLFYSAIFILFGYKKLVGFAGATAGMAKYNLPAPEVFATLAVIFELGGGLLMLIGYQTRLVALALAVYVLVAALIAHTNFADTVQLIQFMKNMAMIGGSLAFVAMGGGKYSVDGGKA